MRLEDKTTLNILARTSSSLLLVVSSIIMVRYLSKNDYGTFLQIMLVVNTVTMLAFAGLPQSIFYFYPQTSDKKHLVKQTLWIGFSISLLSAILVFFASEWLAQLLNNPDVASFSVFMGLMILFQGPVSFRDPILLSQEALILNSITSISASLIDYVPVFIGLLLGANLIDVFFIFVCCKIINFIIFLCTIKIMLNNSVVPSIEKKLYTIKYKRVSCLSQIKYSFPIGIASYIGLIGKQIDKYIISIFFSTGQFAVYSRGSMEVPFISTITYTINDISMTRYVEAYQKKDIKEFLRLMHVNIDKVAKINFGVFAFLFFEARLLIETLYTDEYSSATPIFQVYLFLLFLAITVYNMIPRVTGHTHQLTIATSLSVIVNIILSLCFIPLLGPVGAAIGTVFGSFCYMAYLLFAGSRSLDVSWLSIMPWGYLGRILVISLFPLLGLYFYHFYGIQFEFLGNFGVLLGAFFVYLYLYLAGLNLFGLLRPEDRSFIVRWVRFNLFLILPSQRFGPR